MADLSGVNAAKQAFVENTLMPAAVNFLRSTLRVVPVEGNLYVPRFCNSRWSDGRCAGYNASPKCGSDITIPADHLGPDEYWASWSGAKQTMPSGNGLSNTDTVVYVTAIQAGPCPPAGSSSGTVAYASSCGQDQFGRPTATYINYW